jgi:hypothetical protein
MKLGMILLITGSSCGKECAKALETMAQSKVVLVSNLAEGERELRQQGYVAAVVDQLLMESEPEAAELFVEHLGTAMPVFVNFAICGMERFVREVRLALERRRRELESAEASAQENLRNELESSLTAMLLSCELALKETDVPGPVLQRLIQVNDLAREMSGKLAVVTPA